ncbi:hypothetical protein PROFUN_14124 [Planoprotostelium fungivorum]|uniref:DBF4-type domain-containing protein n=1 Tax=Planoprotostelium fungivorum TaxID=1890364 RepID=A0A2P6N1F8_9EUKA|nr:hypothetical protein PROFUN_14124 [Planoprotostelium fungivorum]
MNSSAVRSSVMEIRNTAKTHVITTQITLSTAVPLLKTTMGAKLGRPTHHIMSRQTLPSVDDKGKLVNHLQGGEHSADQLPPFMMTQNMYRRSEQESQMSLPKTETSHARPGLFVPLHGTTNTEEPRPHLFTSVTPRTSFEGCVFFLDVSSSITKKLVNPIVAFGGKVEGTFNVSLITHLITNQAPSHNPSTDLTDNSSYVPTRRKKILKSSVGGESKDFVSMCKMYNKTIWTVQDLIMALSRLSNLQHARNAKRATQPNLTGPKVNSLLFNHATAQQHPAFSIPSMLSNGHSNYMSSSVPNAIPPPLKHSMMLPNQNMSNYSSSGSQMKALPKSSLIVEDTVTNCKPLIKHFSTIEKRGHSCFPKLNLESTFPLLSPFLSYEEALIVWKKKNEREAAERETPAKPAKKEGWCECCLVKYEDLDQHVKTMKHVDYAMNDGNYAEIDAFIRDMNGET